MNDPELTHVIDAVNTLSDVVTQALNESGRGPLAARTADLLEAVVGKLRQLDARLTGTAPATSEVSATVPVQLEGTLPVPLPRTVVAQIVRDYQWLSETPTA